MNKLNLNIAYTLQDSEVNGPGKRDIFWVQGCAIKCPGCFNQHLWDFKPKFIINVEDLLEKMKTRVGKIEGISILGGEPMHQVKALSFFLKGIRTLGLTSVVYTGFTYEFLLKQNNPFVNDALNHIDILVDGPYRQNLQDKTLVWRGSTNQRILFLSSTYSESVIPETENYHNSELYVFEPDEEGNFTRFRTGII